MDRVLWKSGLHRNGNIFQKIVQLLVYADDIEIVGRSKRDVTVAFSAVERDSTKMCLTVNKYMLSCGSMCYGRPKSVNRVFNVN